MKKLLYAMLAFGMVACGKKDSEVPANQLTSNDFESFEGWLGDMNVPSLNKDKAHSGRWSLKVGPNIEFAMGYNILLGKLSPSKLKKIKVKAWAYLPNGKAQAVLVTQLTRPVEGNKQMMWEGLDLAKDVKTYNKWVEVEKTITLPADANYADKLSMYLWRTNENETAYIDDLSIEKAE
ncbi:hypothetical protein [Hymenobacter sp. CRA2]|uniref:hypothetical protein n=1 Tax=Hymenobacter sp. CRA2 TaxID=1955620 RepID=UPI00098FCEFB|nr:hypothetical protein [Hymenobacter sp. CRA2]OON70802.1 hypothetical protein B0919_01970 [Hymenobacter sp. CRA2]